MIVTHLSNVSDYDSVRNVSPNLTITSTCLLKLKLLYFQMVLYIIICRIKARHFILYNCNRYWNKIQIQEFKPRTTFYYGVLHYTTLHYTALHCTALHCTALPCPALSCPVLSCPALHCTALDFIINDIAHDKAITICVYLNLFKQHYSIYTF